MMSGPVSSNPYKRNPQLQFKAMNSEGLFVREGQRGEESGEEKTVTYHKGGF